MAQVAVLTPSFPRYKDDYHGVFIKELCDNLSKHVTLEIIAPRTRTLHPSTSNYQVHRFPYMPSQRMEYIAEATMKNASKLITACLPAYIASAYLQVLKNNAQLIHTHLAIPLGALAAINPRKTPQLITCHGSDITYPMENHFFLPITRRTLRKADHIATVSHYIKEQAIKLGAPPEKTETIYLGVDINRFTPKKDNETVTIGTLGRLVREKNIDELLYAAKLLTEKTDFQLLIGGDGPEKHRLEKLASKLGIEAEFLGRVHDPAGFHQRLDVFVLASRREGLSISLQEAMSCGAVPVAVNGYGCKEILSDEANGYLYKTGDHEMLAQRILDAIENPSLGRDARTTIVQRFNSKNAAQRYLELYRELGIS
ncbi:MAG: glycosyltransferase [Candidatus Bathyarchaeota archaeon]|nr:glycosyltransferase [Candidatus Bathyarchaeota archaeon]